MDAIKKLYKWQIFILIRREESFRKRLSYVSLSHIFSYLFHNQFQNVQEGSKIMSIYRTLNIQQSFNKLQETSELFSFSKNKTKNILRPKLCLALNPVSFLLLMSSALSVVDLNTQTKVV